MLIGARPKSRVTTAPAAGAARPHLAAQNFHIETRNAGMVTARFAASSACRGLGFTGLRPWPWASPMRLRVAPSRSPWPGSSEDRVEILFVVLARKVSKGPPTRPGPIAARGVMVNAAGRGGERDQKGDAGCRSPQRQGSGGAPGTGAG